MIRIKQKNIYFTKFFIFASLVIHSSFSMAISRIGDAVISESDGLPCFSIPSNSETRNGLPLRQIIVSETSVDGIPTSPDVVWEFSEIDEARRTLLHPAECIRFGEVPANYIEEERKKLELFKVYSVSVVARESNSSMSAYLGTFCMKPDSRGAIKLQNFIRDARLGSARYQVCAHP